MVTSFHVAYLNALHGNDTTASLSDPQHPWKTLTALRTAVDVYHASEEQPLPVSVIDQGTCDPATFIPPFSQH